MDTELLHTVAETENGMRLDALLARLLGCGVRAAKRLAADGRVTVNGKPCLPHYKVRAGSGIIVRQKPDDALPPPLRLAATGREFLAFIKPPGLHTAQIAGNAAWSLEQNLALQWESLRASGLFPENAIVPAGLSPYLGGDAKNAEEEPPATLPATPPVLLSRLDAPTSGLVAAAFSPAGAGKFRIMETKGLVDKFYLAVVHGEAASAFAVTNELDTDNRKKTRVLATPSPDATRHTEIVPLGAAADFFIPEAENGMTLVAAHIKRGGRHQIRAHLAHAGHPILGDALYGTESAPLSLHLHHARLALPGFSGFCLPPWLQFPPKIG